MNRTYVVFNVDMEVVGSFQTINKKEMEEEIAADQGYFSLTITDLRKDGFTATIEYDDETEEQEFTIEEGIQTHLN